MTSMIEWLVKSLNVYFVTNMVLVNWTNAYVVSFLKILTEYILELEYFVADLSGK